MKVILNEKQWREQVVACWDWWDGPILGLTDNRGTPHLFERMFDDLQDEWSNLYRLMPVTDDEYTLLMELWQIWLDFQRADPPSGHGVWGALPQDVERRDELDQVLEALLSHDAERYEVLCLGFDLDDTRSDGVGFRGEAVYMWWSVG